MDTLDNPGLRAAVMVGEDHDNVFGNLMIRAMDVNELCQPFRRDISRVALCVARAMLDIESEREAGRITAGQRDQLMAILKCDLEPTVENDLPVYTLRFPSPDYDPPPRAA